MASTSVQWAALGKYYGFPECCVTQFLIDHCQETKERFPDGPWMGSGFIPCVCCAEEAVEFNEFIETRIQPNRSCTLPFPLDDEVSDEMVVELIKQELSTRPWIQRLSYRLESWWERGLYILQV